jgi:hemerythrin-like domain-containing protein/nucleotide-binding universal stress UspA family protein
MHRHLLVPIDGSDLTTEMVGRAVEYARGAGARITFFHAHPDPSASLSGEPDAVRLVSPESYQYTYVGRARELLAKAESAARAQGVPCESRSATSGSPHQAILAAARECGCDLIFMAPHRRRSGVGMLLGSQTMRVIMFATVPVLVSPVSPPGPAANALAVIRDEHRSIAAVLHAWMHHLSVARLDGRMPDFQLIRAMVRYLRDFPMTQHHPKEDAHLFRRLRSRTSSLDAEIEELERQHGRDRELVQALEALVEGVAAGKADPAELEALVSRYATFVWEHLGREEGVILPAAERHLTAEDWNAIGEAFSGNNDPRFGDDTAAGFRRLFSRIVNLASES